MAVAFRPGGSAQPGLPSDYGSGPIGRPALPVYTVQRPAPPQRVPLPATVTGKAMLPQRATALFTQHQLLRLGYNVAADGMMGPQTTSAWNAMKQGVKPVVWNHQQSVSAGAAAQATLSGVPRLGVYDHTPPVDSKHSNNRTPQQAIKPNAGFGNAANTILGAVPANNAANILALQGLLQKPGKGLPQTGIAGLLALQKGLNPNQVDADALATSDVNAQYGPGIAGLAGQIAAQQAQAASNQDQIASWYQQLVGNIGQRNAENQAADTTAVNNIGSLTGGVAQALGLEGTPGAESIGAIGAIQQNAARANQASEGNYGRDLQSVTASRGVSDRLSQANQDASTLADLQTQKLGQETARGQALVSERGQYRAQNVTNRNAFIGQKSDIQNQINTNREQHYQDSTSARNNYINAKLGIREAAGAASEQHFKDVAGAQTARIAALAAGGKGVADVVKAVNQGTHYASQDKVAATRARAALITATASRTRARAAGLTALNKIGANAKGVFPGSTTSQQGAAALGIGTAIQGDPRLWDANKGAKNIPEVVANVRARMMALDADPRTNERARQLAFSILQTLGINPQKGWYH